MNQSGQTKPIVKMSDFPPRTPPATVSSPSASSLALLSLTQDITALISLSLEATASLVHDWFRSTLDTIGLGEVVAYTGQRKSEPAITSAEGNPGLAVVVVGAGEGELLIDIGLACVELTGIGIACYSYRSISHPPPGQIRLYGLPSGPPPVP